MVIITPYLCLFLTARKCICRIWDLVNGFFVFVFGGDFFVLGGDFFVFGDLFFFFKLFYTFTYTSFYRWAVIIIF